MHHRPIQEITNELSTDERNGLTPEEAKRRLLKYGPNEIEQTKQASISALVLRQFNSPVVFLLLFAAILSFAFSKWGDGVAVVVVLLINTCIGFAMEFQAQRSMNALRSLAKTSAKVIRNGSVREIPAADIVPGDVLSVEAGDIIPADARICRAFQLQVIESVLTGESVPIEKIEKDLPYDTAVADRRNMLFKGTSVTRGNAAAIAVATGMATELGKIALSVQASPDDTTPIERKLEEFSKKLIWITLLLVLVIFFMGILNGKNILDMLNTVIALSVAAIPEGLPIVATLALAYGMMKMAKRNVIVKRLASVETLGGTNVICTDKTGTLTYNQIEVSHIITPDFHSRTGSTITRSARHILEGSVLCNNANIDNRDEASADVGDPLEVGLLRYAEHQHIDIAQVRKEFPKLSEQSFSSDTKMMATLHAADSGNILFAKGAAESIVGRCGFYLDGNVEKPFSKALKEEWLDKAEEEASEGLKVIAFAFTRKNANPAAVDSTDLTFLGVASLMDPPRQDVEEAIRLCRNAGIRVVMVTGDHPSTARNIAHRTGIISGSGEHVVQGSSMPVFEKLSAEQKEEWKAASVFARVSPFQKLDLIKVLQEDHSVVAMTGDGVNDAPALKKADIGIAMGERGTDVAKEVADMVLKDDSFSSIVAAIEEGRIIYENIRKFLMFLLSSNLSEVLVIGALFITNSPLTLIPLQILFINLLSDVFPALALGFSAGSDAIMKRRPRDPRAPVLSNLQWMSVIVYAVVIAASTLSTSLFMLMSAKNEPDLLSGSTVLFYTLIFAQLLHVFNVGDHRQLFFKTDVFRNAYVWAGILLSAFLAIGVYFISPLRDVLHIGPLDVRGVLVIAFCSLQSFVLIQILKKLNLIH